VITLKKQQFLKQATFFSASLFISRLLLSVRGIIIPRLLGPVDYGIYNGVLILPEYLMHFHFGSISALKREIPFCYGKNDFQQAQRIRNIVFSQYLATILISVSLIGLFTYLVQERYSSSIIVALRLVCLLIVAQAVVEVFLENVVRTDNQFSILSNSEIFKSLIGFGFMLIMIWYWHLNGLIASLILSSLLKGGYIYYKTRYQFRWIWDFNELMRLLKIGFPILLGLILFTVFASIDRFMIIHYLDMKQLGYYALGLTVLNFLFIIQTGAYQVLEPKVYRLYGETKEMGALREIIWDPIYGMCVLFPLVMGLAYIGIPYLIYLFLPKYILSLMCIRIMILGSFFFIFRDGTYTFIVAINRQSLIVWVVGIGILVNLMFNFILIKQGWGIEGVALGTIGANILTGGVFLIFTLHHFFKELRNQIKMLIQIFLPAILVGFFLILMDLIWPVGGHWRDEFGFIFLKMGGVILLTGPFIWKLKNQFRALRKEPHF